jgi:putative ABC transport system permease protein
MARLKPGVSLESAAAELQVIAQRDAKVEPKEYPARFSIGTERMLDYLFGKFKKTLYALIAAVFILLLIACSNVANLLLARATVREGEIAIRASLGATRGRLIQQLLIESLILAAGACLVGCGVAYFGTRLVSRIIPPGIVPPETIIGLNPVVLLFAVAAASLTVLACGLVPALHAVRGGLQHRLTGSGKGSGGVA